ncbi:MAG TPA: hypothetical protein VGF99_01220 [Myxococcota bacterium]
MRPAAGSPSSTSPPSIACYTVVAAAPGAALARIDDSNTDDSFISK